MKREEFLNTLFENIPDYTKEEQEELSTTNGGIRILEISKPEMVRILCLPNGIRVIRLRNACQCIPAMPTLR